MRVGGIDIGSRFIKYVVVQDGEPVAFYREDTGHSPAEVSQRLIDQDKTERLVATGYGRYLLEITGDTPTITEIKAVARGAKAVFPKCRTIIDIGGQDTKVISLNGVGMVTAFEMNDRCAAGTGKFLEVMAKTLGFVPTDFGSQCHGSDSTIKINSMCTVFAESEVVSLITKGVLREEIAHALLDSVACRIVALAKRVGVHDDVIFAGGCAKSECLKSILEERLGRSIHVYRKPEMLAAFGAALYAEE